MLHTVLRRRAGGETDEQIRPDLIIPTGRRKGRNPSVASIYRAITAHEKAQAYPEAIEQARAEHAELAAGRQVSAQRQEGESADDAALRVIIARQRESLRTYPPDLSKYDVHIRPAATS